MAIEITNQDQSNAKLGTKKATPSRDGFFRLKCFYLASSYFLRGLPPKYRRRCCVSQPSSRWIGVGPQRYGHQDRNIPKG